MLQALRHYFQQEQYQVFSYGGGMAYVKVLPEEIAVIQLCGSNELAMVNQARMNQEREHFRQQLQANNPIFVPIRFLTIVIVPDEVSDFFRNLAEQVEGLWFLSERQKRLYIFERQSTEYFDLYEPLMEYIEQQEPVKRERQEVAAALRNLQPVTVIFVFLNIVAYIAASFYGDVYDAGYMYSIGAITWDSIFIEHQFYRLLTCMFLHYGIEHLASNMLSLLCLGTMLEKRIGHSRFFLLYLLSGLCSGLTSVCVGYYHYSFLGEAVNTVSAGASGAIFGVIGGLVAVVIGQYKWKRKHADFMEIPLRSLLLMTFFSLFQGFTTAGVDNSAHVGGLVFGFLFAFLLAIKL